MFSLIVPKRGRAARHALASCVSAPLICFHNLKHNILHKLAFPGGLWQGTHFVTQPNKIIKHITNSYYHFVVDKGRLLSVASQTDRRPENCAT